MGLEARPPVPYDALSLDVGITPSAQGVPGALQHATPVKPVSRREPSRRPTMLEGVWLGVNASADGAH